MSTKFETIERASVPAMNELIGKVFPVLDKGHLRVIDYMGSDEAVVQAARVSYGKGTKAITEDRGLLRFLMRHRHTTPFEMCELKVHIRIPMDAWRQMIRHRTANVNEYSTRYSIAIDDKMETPPDQWRLQAKSNKQGSKGFLPAETTKPEGGCPVHTHMESDGHCACILGGDHFTRLEQGFHALSWKVYDERIQAGIAKEVARKDLPLSTYTEAYWKMDLHNLFHYLSLRMDPHAQKEIRDFANIIGNEIIAKWCPLGWEAFEDYRLHGMSLSRLDIEALRMLIAGDLNIEGTIPNKRELAEFKAKAQKIMGVHYNGN